MKTSLLRHKLKRFMPAFLVTVLIGLSSTTSISQDIQSSKAILEARKHSTASGFRNLGFSKANLTAVLEGANALKLYNGLTNGDRRNAVLMIIGLDASGNEIGDTFLQADSRSVQVKISRAVKELQVANVAKNRRITAFSTSFSASELLKILSTNGVEGLDFVPSTSLDADGKSVLTMIAVPSGSTPEVSGMKAMKSPCPPDCKF